MVNHDLPSIVNISLTSELFNIVVLLKCMVTHGKILNSKAKK